VSDFSWWSITASLTASFHSRDEPSSQLDRSKKGNMYKLFEVSQE
jgi:hypothetical protein